MQTSAAQVLRKLLQSTNVCDADRQAVMSFLSGEETSGYSPTSGKITGILKQTGEEAAGLSEATAAEEEAFELHEEPAAAKMKEIAAHACVSEEKSVRVGELGVSAVELKKDLENSQEALMADQAFLAG